MAPRACSWRALVHDVDERLRDRLADLVGVDRHVLAVEVGLHAVADRLVEEDARRARREHHRHLAGRGRGGLEEHHRVLDALADHPVDPVRRVVGDVVPGRDVVGVLLALAVLLGDAGEAHRGHGLQVLDDLPVRVGEEHRPRLVHEVDADLAHARVGAHGFLVHRAQERELRLRPHVLPARLHGVAGRQLAGRVEADGGRSRRPGRDGGGRLRRKAQALGGQVLGEAVARLVALDHPDSDAQLHVGEGAVHGAVFQEVGVRHLVLEEDVGEVTAAREGLAEGRLDQLLRDPEAGEVPDPGGGPGAGRGQGPGRSGQDVVGRDRAHGGGAEAKGLATAHSTIFRHARTSNRTTGDFCLRRDGHAGSFTRELNAPYFAAGAAAGAGSRVDCQRAILQAAPSFT